MDVCVSVLITSLDWNSGTLYGLCKKDTNEAPKDGGMPGLVSKFDDAHIISPDRAAVEMCERLVDLPKTWWHPQIADATIEYIEKGDMSMAVLLTYVHSIPWQSSVKKANMVWVEESSLNDRCQKAIRVSRRLIE